jgi:hypothetical protein
VENEAEFDHEHCHAAIDRLKAKLQQCAMELDEASNLLRQHYPNCAEIFTKAARVAREQ